MIELNKKSKKIRFMMNNEQLKNKYKTGESRKIDDIFRTKSCSCWEKNTKTVLVTPSKFKGQNTYAMGG